VEAQDAPGAGELRFGRGGMVVALPELREELGGEGVGWVGEAIRAGGLGRVGWTGAIVLFTSTHGRSPCVGQGAVAVTAAAVPAGVAR